MNLLLIGCGNMGGSLLKIWEGLGYFSRIIVVEPSLSHAAQYANQTSVQFIKHISELAADFTLDVIILAIKPQQLNEIWPYLRLQPHTILISLLAGIKIDRFTALAENAQVVRIMPNIAMQHGKSLNLAYAKADLQADNRTRVEVLFATTGKMLWLHSEDEYSYLAPIASSGLAYFLLLAELLREEVIKLGLSQETAQIIAQEVLLGTASVVAQNTDYNALIASIKSKKGVTEAALNVLRPSLEEILSKAIKAGIRRGQELNDESSS